MDDILIKLVMIGIFLLVAFPVHEFAHAWVAYMRGDATAKLFGRLTLNPIVHFDKFGGTMTAISIFVGGFLFGWAKPTPINPANFRNRANDEVIVALAGPAANMLMAIAGALVFRVAGLRYVPGLGFGGYVDQVVYLFVLFNVVLAVFNLIPIPPLDGSNLLFRFLPARTVWEIRPFLSQYGIFIMLAVVFLGGSVIFGVVSGVANFLVGA